MTEKERTLLAGCVKGDKSAWDAFVLQYSALVYHTIKKTLVLYHTEASHDLVDDLFQEVFLSLVKDEFAQLRRFRGDNECTLGGIGKLGKAPSSQPYAQSSERSAPITVSVSHPYFWAPFILLGDGK
jgi:CHAT domain-containing protein